jgi:uncharacterized protein (TIGR02147 family)
MKRIDITDFHDYREFLTRWFEFLRNSTSGFSMRTLSRAAGLSSGYLTLVLQRKRNLSEKSLCALLDHLHLRAHEREYLLRLHRLTDADTQAERLQALKDIQSARVSRGKDPKEFEAYKYLTKWQHVAIREMALFPDFKADARWIQKRLRRYLPLKKITAALRFLTTYDFIRVNEDGTAYATDRAITCDGGVFSLAMAQYHCHALEIAYQAIDQVPHEQRSITGSTLAIPETQFEALTKILEETRKKINALEGTASEGTRVIQVTLAAIPLSKDAKERRLA